MIKKRSRDFFCAFDFVLNARLFAPILYLFQQTIFYLFQVLHIYTPTLIKMKYLDEELFVCAKEKKSKKVVATSH